MSSDKGYGWYVFCEDTFKATRSESGWALFAYCWAVSIGQMLNSLETYMMLKGIRN